MFILELIFRGKIISVIVDIPGALNKPPRGRGPDTVICLDTSGSMAGEPFRKMISIAQEIVEGLCNHF